MRTMCSREIFTKKCRQQQIFDSDLKGAWHYNHVTFTSIAKNFMLYCRLTYMLSILCVRLTVKVKVGIPESFKVGWYPPRKSGSSHLKLFGCSLKLLANVQCTSTRKRGVQLIPARYFTYLKERKCLKSLQSSFCILPQPAF